MTIILAREEFRNAADNARIFIEKYSDKIYGFNFTEPLWRICIQRDSSPLADVIRGGLLRKPSKKRIQHLIDTL